MTHRTRMIRTAVALLTAMIGILAVAGPALARPYTHRPGLIVSNAAPKCHSDLVVAGYNFVPGERILLTLHTRTYPLGVTSATRRGTFAKRVLLPNGVSGRHTITATGNRKDVASIAITIRACPVKKRGGAGLGVEGVSTSAPAAAAGGGGSGGSGTSGASGFLASTGVAIAGIGALGVGLLAFGLMFLRGGRRRHGLA